MPSGKPVKKDKWDEFLEHYATLGSINAAAAKIGIHRNTVTRKKAKDREFRKRFESAHASFVDDFVHSWSVWYRNELKKGERFPIEVAKLMYEHQSRIGGVPAARKPERLGGNARPGK